MLPTTPTLNPEYNGLLVKWAAETGKPCLPECETCGADLTGEPVFEYSAGWACGECIEGELQADVEYASVRRAERRQEVR